MRRNRRASWREAFAAMRPWLLLIALVGVWFALQEAGVVGSRFEAPQPVSAQFPLCDSPGYKANCVVDGDTIRIGDRRIRLTGFDAPEIEGACRRESDLAIAARDRLHRWLALGPFELSGGASPPRDQYGRELRAARRHYADGREQYLAEVMVDAGLARSDDWYEGGNAWC